MVTLKCVKCGADVAAVQLPQLDARSRVMAKSLGAFVPGVDLVGLLSDPAQLSAALGVQCVSCGDA